MTIAIPIVFAAAILLLVFGGRCRDEVPPRVRISRPQPGKQTSRTMMCARCRHVRVLQMACLEGTWLTPDEADVLFLAGDKQP
jgi:hypothetical protein